MKYLFLINSHTTFLSSIGTINFMGLKDEDIRFAFIRNYKIKLYEVKSPMVDLSWAFEYPYFKNIIHFKSFINKIDNILSELLCGDDYVMCASFPGNIRLYQIIFSNKKCIGFKYIQEGALPFNNVYKNNNIPLLYRAYGYLLRLLYSNRLWSSHGVWTLPDHLKNKLAIPTECYAIDNEFFKNLEYKLNIIKWPSINIQETPYSINPAKPCFVLESSVEMGVVEKETYMECVGMLIREKGESDNYIKYHPYQSDDNKREIEKMFTDLNYNVTILPMDVPFEFYLSSYNSMKVYGFKSSLLVFAQKLGHITYSMEDQLLEKSQKYRKFRSSR